MPQKPPQINPQPKTLKIDQKQKHTSNKSRPPNTNEKLHAIQNYKQQLLLNRTSEWHKVYKKGAIAARPITWTALNFSAFDSKRTQAAGGRENKKTVLRTQWPTPISGNPRKTKLKQANVRQRAVFGGPNQTRAKVHCVAWKTRQFGVEGQRMKVTDVWRNWPRMGECKFGNLSEDLQVGIVRVIKCLWLFGGLLKFWKNN